MKTKCRWFRQSVTAMLLACAFTVTGAALAAPETDSNLSARLEKGGFTKEQSQRVIQSVDAARKAGLPVDSLLSRIDEGLAKQAPADALERAVQARLQSLESAKTLLAASYSNVAAEPFRQLLAATALALESGVSADDLRAIIARGKGEFAMRMTSVIAAGESLHLAGLGQATTLALMSDCLDRNLGRREILRVVNYCIQQHHAGIDDAEMRAALWGSPANTNNTSCGPGGMRGGQCRGAANSGSSSDPDRGRR